MNALRPMMARTRNRSVPVYEAMERMTQADGASLFANGGDHDGCGADSSAVGGLSYSHGDEAGALDALAVADGCCTKGVGVRVLPDGAFMMVRGWRAGAVACFTEPDGSKSEALLC